MRNCDSSRFWCWRSVRIAVTAVAGLAVFALLAAPGYGDTSEDPSTITASNLVGPYPDPGNQLTDPGTPGNPPPPIAGIDAPGPGSPDGGAVLAPGGPPDFLCFLATGQQSEECLTTSVSEAFSVCATQPNLYPFSLVESLASDGTVLRTWQFGPNGCQKVSLVANSILTMIDESQEPRVTLTGASGGLIGSTDDFLCQVPIHNPYFPDDWRNQAKCTWTGGNSWLATFTNYGDRPVDMSEWYGNSRHGRTELRPGEAEILPLHSYGEFFIGAGGPAGPPIKVTVTDYRNATYFNELWIRDSSTIQQLDISDSTAVNLSPYPINLRWSANSPHGVDVAPFGRVTIKDSRGCCVTGTKAYGNGEVARVLIIRPNSGGIDTDYDIVTPFPSAPGYPATNVTYIYNEYSSVRVENVGTRGVILTSWFDVIPGWIIGHIYLPAGQTKVLPLFDESIGLPATSITGLVDLPPPPQNPPGTSTRIRTTNWTLCCGTRFTPTLNTLTGSATGLDNGQVQLSLQGRFTLPLLGGALNLNLSRANVQLVDLLDEGRPAGELPPGPDDQSQVGAAGELVKAVGALGTQLVPIRTNGLTTTFSEIPPPGASPLFEMAITRRGLRTFDFTLDVAKSALSGEPQLCSAAQPSVTNLATRFFIYSSQGSPIDVATTQDWECVGSEPQEPSELLLQ